MNQNQKIKKTSDTKVNDEIAQTESLIKDKLLIEYNFDLAESPFAKQKRLSQTTIASINQSPLNQVPHKRDIASFSKAFDRHKGMTIIQDCDTLLGNCDDDSSGIIEFYAKKNKSEETTPSYSTKNHSRNLQIAGRRYL